MRLHGFFVVFLVEVLHFFLEVDLEDYAKQDDAAYDAYYGKWVCACIAVGYDWYASFEWMYLIYLFKSCVGSTEARCVGDGSTKSAYHHREIIHCRDEVA